MSDVDELFRLLTAAPPRSAQIVRRFAFKQEPLTSLATDFAIDEANAQLLVVRALLDVMSGGTAHVQDHSEPTVAARLFAGDPADEMTRVLLSFVRDLHTHAAELEQRLARAAEEFERSPDRGRDEWLRRLAIAVVIGLTAFFYLREQNKPRPPPEKRPVIVPQP